MPRCGRWPPFVCRSAGRVVLQADGVFEGAEFVVEVVEQGWQGAPASGQSERDLVVGAGVLFRPVDPPVDGGRGPVDE